MALVLARFPMAPVYVDALLKSTTRMGGRIGELEGRELRGDADGDLEGRCDVGDAEGVCVVVPQAHTMGRVVSHAAVAVSIQPADVDGAAPVVLVTVGALDVNAVHDVGDRVPEAVQPVQMVAAVVTPAVTMDSLSVAVYRFAQFVEMTVSLTPMTFDVDE